MSGGSYDYLCSAAMSGELSSRERDIYRMYDRLLELGHDKIAADTLKVVQLQRELTTLADSLYDVWKAVEWFDSSTNTDEQPVDKACHEYDKEKSK